MGCRVRHHPFTQFAEDKLARGGFHGAGGQPRYGFSTGQRRRLPGAPPAVKRDAVRVPHLLQVVARQRRAEPAPAVEHHQRIFIGNRLLDIPLDHALAQVYGARRVPRVPLGVLPHVHQQVRRPCLAHLPVGVNIHLPYARFGVVHNGQKARRMMMLFRIVCHVQSTRRMRAPTRASLASIFS